MIRTSRTTVPFAALLVLAPFVGAASAQQQSLFGGGGAAGGAAAATGGGPTTTGASFEQGGPQITTELGGLSQQAGQQAGFLGRGVEGAGLLGTAQGQTGAQAGNFGGGGAAPNFRPGGGGQGGANNGGGGRASGSARQAIRPVIRIAFSHPEPVSEALVGSVGTRIVSISTRRPEFAGVRIRLGDGGTAVLEGTAPTQDAARLAAAFVRLEPGVRDVQNELVVP